MAEVTVPDKVLNRIRKDAYLLTDKLIEALGEHGTELSFGFSEHRYTEFREKWVDDFIKVAIKEYERNPEYRKRIDASI